MAVFEYGCPLCGLRKEKLFRKTPPDTISCPACNADAPRLLSDFGFAFGSGKVPGNTGVDSLDSSIDKIVGRDADSRWESVKDRNSRKNRLKRETNAPIRMNSEGEYETMSDTEVQRFKNLHKENHAAVERYKALRTKKPEE